MQELEEKLKMDIPPYPEILYKMKGNYKLVLLVTILGELIWRS